MLDTCLLPPLGGPALSFALSTSSPRALSSGVNLDAINFSQLSRLGGHLLSSYSKLAVYSGHFQCSAGKAAVHQRIGCLKHQDMLFAAEPMQMRSVVQRRSRVGCRGAQRQKNTSDINNPEQNCRLQSALIRVSRPAATRSVTVQIAHVHRAAFSSQKNATSPHKVMTSAVPSPIIPNEKREPHQLRPPITVIATDVDGTLLDSKQQLRQETVVALKAAIAKGIQVLIATGKARGPWIDTVLPQLGLTTPGVYMQGLILYDGDGSILYERCMDEDVARKVIQLGVEENVTVTAYCGNRILCAERDKHTDRLIGYGEPVPEAMGSLLDVVGKIPINKLLYMGEQSAIDAIRPAVQAALGGEATLVTALNGMLEVLPPGASKGLGLKMVLERMAVDARHVLAIGDGENDIEMLRLAGTSVAMGNAGADVKAAAQFVTSSNDENGLALAVECFVLGGLESGRCRVGEGGRIEMVERVEVMR